MNSTTAATPKVGDILSSSWGYDQTNVDFYKVKKVMAKSVAIVQIGTSETSVGYLTGKAIPFGAEQGEVMTKRFRLTDDGYGVRIASYASAYLWDGKPKYCSHTH